MEPFVNVASQSGNVRFNFGSDPIRDLVPFAIGYRGAARALAASFAGDAYADYDGYPVLFLYRHSLELFLKAVVFRGAIAVGLVGLKGPNIPDLFSNHGLARLLPALRAIFRNMDWDFDATPIGTWAEFERTVRELDGIDPQSYAFRYPITTTGHTHLPPDFTINIPNFAATMDVILDYLEGACGLLEETIQFEVDAKREVEQLLGREG